ncbi:unnamed protein product [Effrenium voratum]|nr:unnamed protein product [Effrenium voratum]
MSKETKALALIVLILALHAQLTAAKCNREPLKKMQREWTNVVTVYEADWVSYITWLACAGAGAASGGTLLALCAAPILQKLMVTELFKAAISHGAVDEMGIMDKIRTGANFFVDGQEAAVKILTYQCKVCNCRVCFPWGFNCGKCGEWCVKEPNRHALVLGYRSASGGSGGSGGTPDLECHTIRNRCRVADFEMAVGYKISGSDNWKTEAWWRVNRGNQVRLCFARGTWLYAFFDWVDGRDAVSSDVTFSSLGDAGTFCVKNSKTTIIERPNSPRFYDVDTGKTASTCDGLGGSSKSFTPLDDGDYGISNVNSCPSGHLRSNHSAVVDGTAGASNSTLALREMALGNETLMVFEEDPGTHRYKKAQQVGNPGWP